MTLTCTTGLIERTHCLVHGQDDICIQRDVVMQDLTTPSACHQTCRAPQQALPQPAAWLRAPTSALPVPKRPWRPLNLFQLVAAG